jgi:hypothetical protein
MARDQVFISYSHADSPWLKRVQTMLAPLIGSDRAVVWSDEKITPGTKWNSEIETALVSAKVAVLLVSDNFLASPYIKNSELPALLRAADKGQLVLLWLAIGPCLWEQSDLVNYQAALDPKHPLSSLDETAAKAVLADLARQVAKALGSDPFRVVDPLQLTTSVLDLADESAFQFIATSGGMSRRAVGSLQTIRDAAGTPQELGYIGVPSDNNLAVTPQFPYRDLLRRGGPITPLSWSWAPFMPWPLALDFRIVNNTSKTVLITEAVVHVAESQPDLEPVLVIQEDQFLRWVGRFHLRNEGWGTVESARVNVRFARHAASVAAKSIEPPFPHEIEVPNFDAEQDVDLTGALAKEGVNWAEIDALQRTPREGSGPDAKVEIDHPREGTITLTGEEHERRLAAACGPYPEGLVDVLGEMHYRWTDSSQRVSEQTFRFFTTVVLYSRHMAGRPMPPTAGYGVKLDVEGKDYKRRVKLSHSLSPTEADRLLIIFGVDRSSSHRLRVDFILSTGETLSSGEVTLEAIVPRSWLDFLQPPVPEQP